MVDIHDSQSQPIAELAALRQQVTQLQTALDQRQQTAVALYKSEAQYRHLFENSLGLICIHDLDGYVLSVNPAAARTLGYRPYELEGRSFQALLTPNDRSKFQAYIERIRTQPVDIGIMRAMTKTGDERVLSYRNVRVEEPGQPPYILGHGQDITDLYRTQQALRRSEEHYRLVVEGSIQGMYIHQHGIIQFANAALASVFGYDSTEELIGQHFQVLVAPDEISRLEAYRTQRLQGGVAPERYEY